MDKQQRAAMNKQRAAMDEQHRAALQRLRAVYDPSGVCRGLARALVEQGHVCDHSFRFTRAYLADYAPDVNADQYVALLDQAGYHCDCEAGYNLCSKLGV